MYFNVEQYEICKKMIILKPLKGTVIKNVSLFFMRLSYSWNKTRGYKSVISQEGMPFSNLLYISFFQSNNIMLIINERWTKAIQLTCLRRKITLQNVKNKFILYQGSYLNYGFILLIWDYFWAILFTIFGRLVASQIYISSYNVL